jgi:hypothetical protein
MRGNKLSVNRSKKEAQREVKMAKGGSPRGMVGPQAAGPVKPGRMGKTETAAPGASHAKGGSTRFNIGGVSRPARPA